MLELPMLKSILLHNSFKMLDLIECWDVLGV
jgi:hypothetical protein